MNNNRVTLLSIIEKHGKSNIRITVSALAKAAGISRSSIYKYYPDVLDAIDRAKANMSSSVRNESIHKIDLMRSQLVKSKELVSYLTNICTNQLIEISELKISLRDLESNTTAKISYLHSKLSKLEKNPLRVVNVD